MVNCDLPREGESRRLIRQQRRLPAFLFSFVHLLFPLMAMWTTLRKLQVAHIATAPTTTQLSTVQIIKIKERRGQPG